MEVIQRVRVACPRCQAPVAGDFKFCPTCAYRLKAGASAAEVLPEPGRRSVASLVLLVAGAFFVALIVGVGVWLFRDPAPAQPTAATGRNGEILPPADLRAATVRRYLKTIPPGIAYYGKDVEEDVARPMQVEALAALLYETPGAFYDEFLSDLQARLAEGGKPPPTLERLWTRLITDDEETSRKYLRFWVESYLRQIGLEATETTPPPEYLLEFVPTERREHARTSIEALAAEVTFPWPARLGLLLLAPPHWVYQNDFEDLRWRLPPGAETLPVTNVSWFDAVAFAEWLTERTGGDLEFRLPLAGEWMRIAHGNHPPPGGWDYPWGDDLLTHACNNAELYAPEVRPVLHPVSQRYIDVDSDGKTQDGRTVDGIFGMAGNAAEWVLAQANTPERIGESFRVYFHAPDEDGRTFGWFYGGNFRSRLVDCKVESAQARGKHERSDGIGFRVVAVSRAR